MPSISNNVIRFSAADWTAGLHPQYRTGATDMPAPSGGNKLGFASKFNPFYHLNYASPGALQTDFTNVSAVANVCLNVALGSESATEYAYLIESGSKLHRLDISTKTISNAGSWPHTITGAGTITGSDVCAYNANVSSTRTRLIFYSWNDASGAWNVGIFNTSAGTFDDDFMTTVPASPLSASGNTKPHPMIVGADDLLYIGDGNVLHSYDGATGANGTFNSTRLTLPAGHIIRSFAKTNIFLIVFSHYSGTGDAVTPNVASSGGAMAWFYNYLDQDITESYPLGDGVVTAAFEYPGGIGCFTQGAKGSQEGENRFSRLRLYDGGKFAVATSFIGNAPLHGGVDVIGDSIQWNSDGIIHCWGSPYEDVKSGLNKIAAGAGTTRGVLRTIGGSTGFQMVSSGATTSGGLQYLAVGDYAANASMVTDIAIPNMPPGSVAKATMVVIHYADHASGGRELRADIITDNGSNTQIISGVSTVNSANIVTKKEYSVQGATLPRFHECRLYLLWEAGSSENDAPLVRYVDVHYDIIPAEPT